MSGSNLSTNLGPGRAAGRDHALEFLPTQRTLNLKAASPAPAPALIAPDPPFSTISKRTTTFPHCIIHKLANGTLGAVVPWLTLFWVLKGPCHCCSDCSTHCAITAKSHPPLGAKQERVLAIGARDKVRLPRGMGVANMRPRQIILTGGFLCFLICIFSLFRLSPTGTRITSPGAFSYTAGNYHDSAARPPPPAPEPFNPKPKPVPAGSHPIWHLVTAAEREFEHTKARQSKTLEEAVAEYRRRYRIPPPPNFDKWFAFAQAKGVQLIDEFDMIHESLTPFWGLKPLTIRERAKEALGFDNALLGISIRGGKTTHVQGGGDWQREATVGMMGKFIEWLPNMDLCFNLHDEPRVTVPHDDLAKLVRRGLETNMPRAYMNQQPRNQFSNTKTGLTSGHGFEEQKFTRFNIFAHQPTWSHSRLSCPPESPTRAIEEDEKRDDLSKYALGDLGFIYNVTAMSDICNSPSLGTSFGFFDRPNAYNIVLDLFPIFSQSKISSYSDILYPSPWYWYEKVSYDEKKDIAWNKKEDKLYWRGSTTGGFSRNGGWRRQHRQRFVQKINAAEGAKIMVNKGSDTEQHWEPKGVNRGDYKDIMDVYFSGVGQCDPGDCDAQKEFFTIKGHAGQQDAWNYKYLLDIDGNAFSGRFYAFLKSRSLIFKWAIFREWHLEWLKPWAHYIPLSAQGEEWLEAVRFFGDGPLGKQEAERLANQQRDWANKVLRHEDMEVWFFRLLLEYGRLIDDDRESIGFSVNGAAPAIKEVLVGKPV